MLKQFFTFLRSKNNFSRFCGPWRVPFSGSLLHQMASVRCCRRKLPKNRKFHGFFKVRFKFKDGFRTVPKLFLDHFGALKKVFDTFVRSKNIFLALESALTFAIFCNFRLRQRTEAISCKSGPLKSTLQGSQRRGKCFFDLKNFTNLL